MISFDKLNSYKTQFATFFDHRFIEILEGLNDNDPITIEECGRLLGVSYQRVATVIRESERQYRKGKWDVNLKELLISNPNNFRQKLLLKKDVAEVLKFIQHKEILNEIRKNKIAYKKAMNEKYGTSTYTTKQCIKASYNCDKCPNFNACNIANNKPFVKRLSVIMLMLDKNNYEPKPYSKIFQLEQELEKAKKEIINLKIKISEQQTLLLKAAKEIKTHYEEVA